jgi:hypothetical protein
VSRLSGSVARLLDLKAAAMLQDKQSLLSPYHSMPTLNKAFALYREQAICVPYTLP